MPKSTDRRNLVLRLSMLAMVTALRALPADAAPSDEESRLIDRLIARVAAAQGIVFVRNGDEASGEAAAKHLRDKYLYFKQRIVTANDFIRLAGTQSELTGVAYLVRLPDGTTLGSADFLRAELKALRSESTPEGTTRRQK